MENHPDVVADAENGKNGVIITLITLITLRSLITQSPSSVRYLHLLLQQGSGARLH